MASTNGKDLIVVDKTVALIGDETSLETVTDRLMALHPAANQVGIVGMRLVAQLAIMTGANPLPTSGEVWVWKDHDRMVVDLGIAYYRRMARRNDEVFWIDEPRPMTESERSRFTVPEGSLASICKAYCGSKLVRLIEMGARWDVAETRVARTSIGVVDRFEMFRKNGGKYWKAGDPIDPPKGRTWQWVCDKRAEKGFYRMEALIDTTFTDRLEQVQRMVAEIGDRPSVGTPEQQRAMMLALQEEYGAELPDDFYGDDEGDYIDGAAEVVTETVDEETGEIVTTATPVDDMPPWEGKSEFGDDETEPAAAEPAPAISHEEREKYMRIAARAGSMKEFAEAIVAAQVGYSNVPHVVQAVTSKNKGFNECNGKKGQPFVFPDADIQDVANWLVERKQVPA